MTKPAAREFQVRFRALSPNLAVLPVPGRLIPLVPKITAVSHTADMVLVWNLDWFPFHVVRQQQGDTA